MNEFLLFMLFSTLEYYSILFVSLVLWSFDTSSKLKILYLSLILSAISYIFREFGLDSLSPVYTLVFMIIIFMMFYSARIKYAILIAISGYAISSVVQVILVGLLLYFKILEMSDLSSFTAKGYMTQLATCILIMIIGIRTRSLKVQKLEFVPEIQYRLKKPVFTNTILISLSAFVGTFIVLTYFAITYFKANVLIYVFLIGLIVLVSAFLFSLYKRDSEEFGHLG